MVNIARWKKFLILTLCALGVLYSVPNLLGAEARGWLQSHLPSWMPSKTVNLGLDLRGGAHLLYEVDLGTVFKDQAEAMVQDVRVQLREKKIGYTRIGPTQYGVRVTLRDPAQGDDVRRVLRGAAENIDVLSSEGGQILEARLNEAGIKVIVDRTLSQSIEIVRRRVDELGTTEPTIVRQGENRILLQVPGADSEDLKRIVGKTAQLTFHLVQEGVSAGGRRLPMAEDPMQQIPIERRAIISGDMLQTAQPSFDQNGQAVVSFRFNNMGSRRFCDVTRNNVNKPFAIVLDNEIISAPVIREPICGGSGQISGGFTVQSANDLALLLRAGALPAPLRVIEERTVGPTLGADSVEAGKMACAMALLFVSVFAIMAFGLFGIFAAISLVFNVTMIIAVLSMLQATLTLPGIAGIVLTIGLAVDANVLIYERMKEELRAGHSVISAIDIGYKRARTTIIDANLTSLIAALILFSFGTGPVKGFAVTMCIGVVTSYFCAMYFARLMILSWLNWKKPKTIEV